jgi:hypothetical protein
MASFLSMASLRYPERAVNTGNVLDAAQRFAWTTCGQTVQFLLGRVSQLGGDVRREDQVTFGQGQGQAMANLLAAHVGVLTFYEAHNPLLNQFVIEKSPADQAAVLQQGTSRPIGQHGGPASPRGW